MHGSSATGHDAGRFATQGLVRVCVARSPCFDAHPVSSAPCHAALIAFFPASFQRYPWSAKYPLNGTCWVCSLRPDTHYSDAACMPAACGVLF